MKICALIPTYNNVTTVAAVVRETLAHLPVIVVADGPTDGSLEAVASLSSDGERDANPLTIVSYTPNRGKGYALKRGFQEARRLGYTHVLTLDSDGQHLPTEIPALVRMARVHPDSIIMGSRRMGQTNMPGKNTFANKFSNFWFAVQTGRYLPDTQTGMRVYPLAHLHGEWAMTRRYEAELLLLVFSMWANVQIIPVPIEVYYPPREERVSYFRPARDFTRISILNTILCVLAVCYGLPRRWLPGIYYGSLFVLDAVLYVNPAVILINLFVRDPQRRSLRLRRMMERNAWFLLRAVPGVPYRVQYEAGAEPIGAHGPEILIFNHNSLLDSQAQLTLGVDAVSIVKPWTLRNFFFGRAVAAAGAFSTERPIEEALPELRELVAKGQSIVIYPEGTRSTDGCIGRFHRGAFYLAEQLQLPVRPIFIHDLHQVFGKMEVHIGMPKETVTHVFAPIRVTDYRQATRDMHRWYQEVEQTIREYE